jgi:hypothetical protein
METLKLTISSLEARKFRIEVPDQIEVQGEKERKVVRSEDWFILPKEQGEYVLVVRELNPARPFVSEKHLSVYRIDHIPRRWFVVLTAIGAVAGFVGTVNALRRKQKT